MVASATRARPWLPPTTPARPRWPRRRYPSRSPTSAAQSSTTGSRASHTPRPQPGRAMPRARLAPASRIMARSPCSVPSPANSAPTGETRGPPALLLPAGSEPRHQATQAAPHLLARVAGDPADGVVGLDDPQFFVRRAHGAPAGDGLGGLRTVARAAGLGLVGLRLEAGDVGVGIRRSRGCVGVVGHGTDSSTYRVVPPPRRSFGRIVSSRGART